MEHLDLSMAVPTGSQDGAATSALPAFVVGVPPPDVWVVPPSSAGRGTGGRRQWPRNWMPSLVDGGAARNCRPHPEECRRILKALDAWHGLKFCSSFPPMCPNCSFVFILFAGRVVFYNRTVYTIACFERLEQLQGEEELATERHVLPTAGPVL